MSHYIGTNMSLPAQTTRTARPQSNPRLDLVRPHQCVSLGTFAGYAISVTCLHLGQSMVLDYGQVEHTGTGLDEQLPFVACLGS